MARGAGLLRLVAELRAAPSPREVDAAVERLVASRGKTDAALVDLVGAGLAVGDDVVVLGEEGAEARSGEAAEGRVDLRFAPSAVVRIGRNVYARVPTREARVALLRRAAEAAKVAIVLHVAIENEGSYLGRIVIDAPRRVLRAAGARAPEPGDRFGPDRYGHCFFDEEALLEEIGEAGLLIAKRRGFTFVLRAANGAVAREHADSFATELARVARIMREVDAARLTESPREALAAMRARGAGAKTRGPVGRARLRRAIGWIDAALPGAASCYRRILTEVALDAGAARETVVFGLDVGSTGHVAFEDREERAFDVSFAIPGSR